MLLISLLVVILVAALAYYLCGLLGLPQPVAVIAAVLVLLVGVTHAGGTW